MLDYGKYGVLGIGIDAIDYEAAVGRIVDAAEADQPMSVTALAVHGVMTGVLDRQHAYRLNQVDLVCPDGQPVRWALNGLYRTAFAGPELTERVYGPELTLRVCGAAADRDLPVFLFGATEEMLTRFAERLQQRYPKLRIAGSRASRFRQLTAEERDELVEEIDASGAKLCFVGLGCPRQEVFIYEMRDRLAMPLIAVGAAFAFHAGALEQAPTWMQRYGLEWLFRLTREPKRLWRRYVYLNPAYLSLLALQRCGLYPRRGVPEQPPEQDLQFG